MMRQRRAAGQSAWPERPAGQREHSRRRVPLGAAAAAGIALVQLLFVFCLGYPPLHAEPHHLPVGIAGPGPAVAQVDMQLSEPRGAYDVHHYADLAAARDGIENRQVYGAIVMVPSGPQLLVASAASPAIADALRAQAARIGGGRPVKVTDVVPAAPNDPQGSGSLTTLLPLVLLSLALGIAIAVLERRRMLQLGYVTLDSAMAGLGVAWTAHAMGTFGGSYWGIAGVLGLLVFGIGTVSAGLAQIAVAGRGLAALLVLLMLNIGVPGAGALVPAPLLAQPWRAIGPYLPPGAAVNAMRGIGFFHGAAITAPLLVLAAWAAAGLALAALPLASPASRVT